MGKSILWIPDCQVRPDVPTDHLSWISNFIEEKQPDVVILGGDFSDMPSLSSYDVGKAVAEGRRYQDDIRATWAAMYRLTRFTKVRGYNPRMVLTLGNHEDRIDREAEANPKFKGWISTLDLKYAEYGWEVHPFLEVVTIEGIEFAHYFVSGTKNYPIQTAQKLLEIRHSSAVCGHIQKTSIHFHGPTGHVGIIAGCCYLHEEKYLGKQMEGKAQRRQVVMLHEVHEGIADPMFVSLAFLKQKYS